MTHEQMAALARETMGYFACSSPAPSHEHDDGGCAACTIEKRILAALTRCQTETQAATVERAQGQSEYPPEVLLRRVQQRLGQLIEDAIEAGENVTVSYLRVASAVFNEKPPTKLVPAVPE